MRVVNIYRGKTTDWIRLSWTERGQIKELISTPGHHFLDQFGQFPTIEGMLTDSMATIVLASGELVEVRAERIVYTAETSHMFERAVAHSEMVGNAVLQPVELAAWATYNFEVEELHTYVAGGVRVHNQSGDKLSDLQSNVDSLLRNGSPPDSGYSSSLSPDAKGTSGILTIPSLTNSLDLPGLSSGPGGSTSLGHEKPDNSTGSGGSNAGSASGTGSNSGNSASSGGSGSATGGATTNSPGTTSGSNSQVGGSTTNTPGNVSGQNSQVTVDGSFRPDRDPSTPMAPVVLDLDGNGVKITEFGNSTQFMTGKDGLQHRSSWAGAGDGVLFYDPDGRNAITEARQYVFTEWAPTAQGDLEAIRQVWDTNGDGKLTSADAEFAKFKVMVTNADGQTSVKTLAELGITEIDLTANATRMELPDGSMITGQTTYQRANGTTGTVANTPLVTDAAGYRVEETVGTDGVNRVVTQTGYGGMRLAA